MKIFVVDSFVVYYYWYWFSGKELIMNEFIEWKYLLNDTGTLVNAIIYWTDAEILVNGISNL